MRNESANSDRKFRLWVVVVWATVIGLLTTLFVVFVINRPAFEAKVRKKDEELRARGIPVALEEVAARYYDPELPPEGNAAASYREAFSAMIAGRSRTGEIFYLLYYMDSDDGLTADQRMLLREVVDFYSSTLVLLKEASERPYLRFNLRFDAGLDFEMGMSAAQIKGGSWLLGAEALVAAWDGDGERAGVVVEAIFRMARHLIDDSLARSTRARTEIAMITSMGRKVLAEVLKETEIPAESVAAIIRDIEGIEETGNLARVIETATALGNRHYRWMGEKPSEAVYLGHWESVASLQAYYSLGLLARDHLEYLSAIEPILAYLELSVEERAISSVPLPRLSDRFTDAQVVASALLAWIPEFLQWDVEEIAAMRVTRVALAAELFRLHHGRFPLGLEELEPEIYGELPGDPFAGGAAFSFVEENSAWRVSSRGMITNRITGSRDAISFRLFPRELKEGNAGSNGDAAGVDSLGRF